MAIMRRLIHSGVSRIFLWVFMLAFVLSGLAVINFGDDKNWVIKAYKQTLTQPKFQAMLKMATQQREMYRQKGFPSAHRNVQKETVQAAISSLLAQHAMHKIGMMVAPKYIETQMQHILQEWPSYFFKADGTLDQEVFKKAIALHGINSIEDFLSEIELDAKNKLLFGLVSTTVYVPEFEAVLQYNAEFADKKYSYITFPLQKYLTQARLNTPSDEVLTKFYKKQTVADSFRTAERRAGTIWTFSQQDFALSITDSEVKAFYDKNKMQRYVVTPAQMQIRTLLIKPELGDDVAAKAKIEDIFQTAQKDPAQFEKLVRQFSQDAKSAARGGLSDFFGKDDKNLEHIVVETAFEHLATDGQICVPLKTDRGYELIQRIKKNAATYKDFKVVAPEIKHELAAEKFKKRFMQDASRVVSSAKYNPESLTKFIARYKGVKTELPLDVRKSGTEFTNLFRIEEGRYTTYLNKDQGVILQCSQVEKSKLPPFEDVKAKVLKLYFEEQAGKLLKEQLNLAFKDALKMNLQDVAQKYGVTIQKATFDYNNGKVEQSPILKEYEIGQKLKALQHVGALATIETKTDGILIKLDSITAVDSKIFKEQKEHLGKIMFYTKLYQIKEGFIASLYRTAKLNNKIEIKNELLQFTKEA